ncbi:MAG: PKD domain-containing protein [Bacteroidota bacterium]
MKNRFLPILLVLVFGVVGCLMLDVSRPEGSKERMEEEEEEGGGIPLRDRMDLAWAQENEMTMDPATGEVPRERLLDAWKYMKSLERRQFKSAIPGIVWTERGPNNQAGRTRAIQIDLNDPSGNTIFAGSVAGGLWKTTNITVASPIWTPINEFMQNLAVTSITQAPNAPQVMYLGTGEGNGNSDAVRGLGIWKSIDGGATWNQLSATNNSSYYYCGKVFTFGMGDTLFACTNSGLYRSVNAGTSFTKVLGSGISSAGGNLSFDIEMTEWGTLYASMSSGSSNSGTIHKSYTKGATWTSPLTITGINKNEIELALAPGDSTVIYGLVEDAQTITGIIKSTNSGVSFAKTTGYPVDADSGIPSTDFSRGQAWYDLSICVNPKNTQEVYVGGVDIFRTINGGTTWQQVAHWYAGFSLQYAHADQHLAMYHPTDTNIAYFGNDGGIYRTSNAGASMPTLVDKGANYNTIQFYGCDIHPTAGNNYFLAGAQDNGSHQFTTAGINATSEVTGGDGALCHIDQDQPQYQFTSYVYNNYYRSTNSGGSFNSAVSNSTGRFINPTDYDDSLNILYGATSAGSFLRWSNPQTGSTTSTIAVTAFNGGTVSHVKIAPNTPMRVYFGTTSGRVAYLDSCNTATGTKAGVSLGTPSAGNVSCIEIEKGNANHILLTYSNYGITSIWESVNGGTNWTSVEGNLPDMPVRWVVFNPNNGAQAMIATELGVWTTDLLNGASTDWQPSNTGLANVRCDMIKIRQSDKTAIVATHGRGLYSTDGFGIPASPTASFTMSLPVAYEASSMSFTNTSTMATTYFWNFGDGTNSALANPTKTYVNAGTYTVTLVINGGVSVMNKNITVLPAKGVPYAITDGGNFEVNTSHFAAVTTTGTGFERGNSAITGKSGVAGGSNAWVTGLTAATYADNSLSYLYTPCYNFTASGTYTIRFYAKNIFELSYDGYRVEYSTNGGTSWLPLATAVGTNWYDYANGSTGRPFPQNQAFFNATNSAYTLKSYATTALQGNSKVAFRFVFGSDANTSAAGLAIDNFEILGPVNIALPVSLLAFDGKRSSKSTVDLNWQTASEEGVSGFSIERKFDWHATFETVDFVNSKGAQGQKSEYTFTDANDYPYNTYYRIKMVDMDGTSEYTKVITVKGYEDPSSKFIESVYPLAGNDKRFVVKTTLTEPLQVEMMNNNGQLVKTTALQASTILDCSDFAAGIYYARFTSEAGHKQVVKIFVR